MWAPPAMFCLRCTPPECALEMGRRTPYLSAGSISSHVRQFFSPAALHKVFRVMLPSQKSSKTSSSDKEERMFTCPHSMAQPLRRRLSSEPSTEFTVWFDRPQRRSAMTGLAVNDHCHMFRKGAKEMRLDLVLFLLRVVAGHLSVGVPP